MCVETGTIPSKTLREAVVFFTGLNLGSDRRRRVPPIRPTAEMLLSRIEETVVNYPTLAECYKVAALDAANKLRR